MERLTKISEAGNAYYPKCFEEPCCGMGECIDDNCSLMLDACKKLAEYEQLEEQGLLVRLPVATGTNVYAVGSFINCIYDYEHCEATQKWKCEEHVQCEYEKKKYYVKEIKFTSIMKNSIGKSIFLTREEAEKKLEEMKNDL